MTKQLILLMIISGLSAKVIAQESKESIDKVELMKIGFITQKLNLSTSEAKMFWPVYNEYSAELKKLNLKKKEHVSSFRAKINPSNQDANKFINEQFAFKQSSLDLRKKYMNEFKKVLPESKVALLVILEDEFRQNLIEKLTRNHEKN